MPYTVYFHSIPYYVPIIPTYSTSRCFIFSSVKGGVNGGGVNGISLDEGGFHKVDDVNIGPGKFILFSSAKYMYHY